MLFDAQGHLVTVRDTSLSADATTQRIIVLILTSPRLISVDGVATGRPDDLFHPDFGAGLRVSVGALPYPALVSGIRARILKALASDGAIASAPAATVDVVSNGAQLVVNVTAYTNAGNRLDISRPLGG